MTALLSAKERQDLACDRWGCVFRARCAAQAHRCGAGEVDLHDAVDGLQADAIASGLVDAIGQDAVQTMMAEAFRSVRQ
jgi:hypothetical protein